MAKPLVADNTSGVNDKCSISPTLCSCALILITSGLRQQAARLVCRLEPAWGLKTLTSMRVHSKQSPQKFLAAMSSLVPTLELEVKNERVSLVRGCRCGSIRTSEHISESRFTVRSQISL